MKLALFLTAPVLAQGRLRSSNVKGELRPEEASSVPQHSSVSKPIARSLQSSCLSGMTGTLTECTYDTIKALIQATIDEDCATADEELASLLGVELANVQSGTDNLCAEAFRAGSLPFGDITKLGDAFDREFMNGGSAFNNQYETEGGQHVLNEDAARILTVANNVKSPIEFPSHITNFQECNVQAAMCCYVADRTGDMAQVESPESNTDVCHVDMSRAPVSARVANGIAVYEQTATGVEGEGEVYCHGFSWGDADEKYRGNMLFQVAMKENFYDKGYVKNVPGAPMCGCVEQMPVVSKASCTELTSATESWSIQADASSLTIILNNVETTFATCADDDLNQNTKDKNGGADAIDAFIVGEDKCKSSTDSFLENHGLKRSILEVVHITGHPDQQHVSITFNHEVAQDSVTDPDTYEITSVSDGSALSVSSATLDASRKRLTLTTNLQSEGEEYAITIVGNIEMDIAPMVKVPIGTLINFAAASYGYEANVPEASDYTLVYSLDIPNTARYGSSPPQYTTKPDGSIKTFSRIAYFMELDSERHGHQYVWVSMDAFTQVKGHIGVPTAASGAIFQQHVENMNVVTNDPGIYSDTGSHEIRNATGFIEFWPTNYVSNNLFSVEHASDQVFDHGDQRDGGGSYGSMQVHLPSAPGGSDEVLFAFNNWNSGGNIDLGIGNSETGLDGDCRGSLDWTFCNNADSYTIKKLSVLVLVTERYDFSNLDEFGPQGKASTMSDSAGYRIVYDLDMPTNPRYSSDLPVYNTDWSQETPPFSRIAYFMDLDDRFVWVSMDKFSDDARLIGVPTHKSTTNMNRTVAQTLVWNVTVESNDPELDGTGLNGNVEFFTGNYAPLNSIDVPGANSERFDGGDESHDGGSYGCMQVHINSPGQEKTIFAWNRLNDGVTSDLGIGTSTTGEPDWTFAGNAGSYAVRKLSVYVK